ncbi:hypothetical protein [Shinella sp. G-2]|uniref:hypothetical protein n=1 Tax=Shinella sp. G-2 TaxID=3133141 RepID=UPI003D065594
MYKLDSQPQIDAQMARSNLTMVLETARRSRHWFLVYLIGLAMAELRNIERGEPTEV